MLKTDIAIYGGSLGGVLAAYSAAKCGLNVALFEPTAWIGGQLTSQAVPPDEHQWIERTGCTASYRAYRNKVRDYYRNHPYIVDELKRKEFFCPGGSTVSRLAHPPRLALRFLEEMLQPFVDTGVLNVYCNCELKAVRTAGDEIVSFTVAGDYCGDVTARLFLDGSDTGELIAKSGCEYAVGAESREETGELGAPEREDRADMQPVTWSAAVEDRLHGDYTIDKPPEYEFFRRLRTPYDDYPVLSMYGPDSSTGRAKRFGFYDGERDERGNRLFGLFSYRRIVCASHFTDGYVPYDVTMLNWPQNDYFLGNLFDCADAQEHAYLAKQLTLSLLYWLQTEAERADGGKGYRNLALSRDVLGTQDGLTMSAYIRESRRIKSLFTVTETDIRKGGKADFADSVGVGSYPIDLHITTKSHSFFYEPSELFTIPLGALIPVRMRNLLPACKNIGTTHLTNGCYRLHPVEWNIGESCGLLAAYSLQNGVSVREIYKNAETLARFRTFLKENGIQLDWRGTQA